MSIESGLNRLHEIAGDLDICEGLGLYAQDIEEAIAAIRQELESGKWIVVTGAGYDTARHECGSLAEAIEWASQWEQAYSTIAKVFDPAVTYL